MRPRTNLSSKAKPMLVNDPQARIREEAARLDPRLIEMRRDIHSHPELAFEEVGTAGIVAAELTRMGISHRTGVERTGVLGAIKAGRPGPTLALRADMDALPIHEETGLAFASKLDGRMHACGHDIHTVTLLGVAEVLNGMRENLSGRIVLIFPPAEDVLEGAPAKIADDAAEGVDMAIGFHNHPNQPVGSFSFVGAPSLAASDHFDITLRGKSGHAAHPYAAVDPIMGAAHLITQLETLVSREQKPLHPCVVTAGMFQAGTTYNIIPERVHLKGTVRSLQAKARDVAEAEMHLTAIIDSRRMVGSLVNDDRVLEPAIASVRAHFGEVVHEGQPFMGAEDFAEKVPSFQPGIGAGAPGRDDRLHNADYQPDERCIALGVPAPSRIAVDMLA